jgi:hypothetical protein
MLVRYLKMDWKGTILKTTFFAVRVVVVAWDQRLYACMFERLMRLLEIHLSFEGERLYWT